MTEFPPPKKPSSESEGPYRTSVVPASASAHVPCPFCGLAIDPSLARCPRCQVDLDFARCGACSMLGKLGERQCARCGADLPRMVSGEATDAPCPRCEGALNPIEPSEAIDAYHACAKCQGVFLGHHTFATSLQRFESGQPLPPILVEHVEPAPDTVVYLRCPCCGRQMNRKRLARMVVDTCSLHGTWFDRGEVARVLAQPSPSAPPAEKPMPAPARQAIAQAQVEAAMETQKVEERVSFVRSLLSALFGIPPV